MKPTRDQAVEALKVVMDYFPEIMVIAGNDNATVCGLKINEEPIQLFGNNYYSQLEVKYMSSCLMKIPQYEVARVYGTMKGLINFLEEKRKEDLPKYMGNPVNN